MLATAFLLFTLLPGPDAVLLRLKPEVKRKYEYQAYTELGGEKSKQYSDAYKSRSKLRLTCISSRSDKVVFGYVVGGFDGESKHESRRLQEDVKALSYDARGANEIGGRSAGELDEFIGLSFPKKAVKVGDRWQIPASKAKRSQPNEIIQVDSSVVILQVDRIRRNRKSVIVDLSLTSSGTWSLDAPPMGPPGGVATRPNSNPVKITRSGKISVDAKTGLPIFQEFTVKKGDWRGYYKLVLRGK